LQAYRAIKAQLPRLLQPQGWAFLEIGADQGESLLALFPGAKIVKDLAGRNRVVVIAPSQR
jgi:methylase of polypeptide subunit release factors